MTLETHLARSLPHGTHDLRATSPKLFTGCVLLGILKSIEHELQRRGLLSPEDTSPTPLWFIAETERNVFLWRTGQSLDDARKYSFWVDVPALVEKRRAQLDNPTDGNPFINPLWGSAPLDPSLLARERDYLDRLEDLIPTAFRQGEVLSRASETLRVEIDPQSSRQGVVIPGSLHQRGNTTGNHNDS